MGGTPLTYFHLHPNVANAARRIPFPSLPRNSRYVVHKPTDWWGGEGRRDVWKWSGMAGKRRR